MFFCESRIFQKAKRCCCHMSSWVWICKLLQFPTLNHEPFSQPSHTDVRGSDRSPPRGVMAEQICATAATFFSNTVKNATLDLLVLLKAMNFWFSALMLGQIFIAYTELKCPGLLLSGKSLKHSFSANLKLFHFSSSYSCGMTKKFLYLTL